MSEGGDSGTHMDRQAGDRPALPFHLTGVQAGPDLDAEAGYRIADGACATDGPGRPVEGGEEAVAGGVDLHAAEPLKEPPHLRVMILQQVTPPAVTQPPGPNPSSRRCR